MDLDWRDLISRHGHHVTQEGRLVVGHEVEVAWRVGLLGKTTIISAVPASRP